MPEFNPGLIPSPSRAPVIAIAAVVLAAIGAAVFYFNPHSIAETSVTRVQIYNARSETKAIRGTTNIIGAAAHVDNDLYVIVNLKVTDKLRLPIYIDGETAVITQPDHTVVEGDIIQKNELPNLFLMFPALQPLASAPLERNKEIAPGQTAEGMLLLHFPGATEAIWTGKESATLTINLFHQPPQVVTLH